MLGVARCGSFRLAPVIAVEADREMRWIVLMVAVSLLLPSGGFGQHTGRLVDGGPGRGPD